MTDRATPERTERRRTLIHEGWTVAPLRSLRTDPPPPIGATVPGAVHADLLDAGLIPDPFVDRNELEVGWVGETAWRYSNRVVVDTPVRDGEHVDLACEGLDTIATVRVNGIEVGRAESMHTAHRFDIRAAIRHGANTIEIDFEAPAPAARRLADAHGELPHAGHGSNPAHPYNALRKMACSYGWDWGPVLPSVGIWRSIAIERWSVARLGRVRPLVTAVSGEHATLDVHPDVHRAGGVDPGTPLVIDIRVRPPDGAPGAHARAEPGAGPVRVMIPAPRLWWPAGHGDQPLYTVETTLLAGTVPIDRCTQRIGIRTVELVTTPDPEDADPGPRGPGSTFHLRVNARRIFCKGANWIPDDPFPGRITRGRYRARVLQARRANMNMLRVWGGGIYESDAFYDACDEQGIMVWQDFLCACAAYHEHEPYRAWFEAEARDNVARLAPHPSLVLWCGNNECNEGVAHWGGFEKLRDDPSIPWGMGLYTGLFPGVVAELDPTRPYWPASPYTAEHPDQPRREESGDAHIWDVWNGEGDARRYMMHAPRFASEFGFHGPPTWATLERVIPPDQRRFDSPAMVHHNKHAGGQQLANTRLADYFVPPASFDDWHYLAQVVQARSLEIGCTWFRALSPWCSGALYWQFNDIWPVSSWAAVDGDGRPKPLWFATRQFFRPRLVTIRPASVMASIDEPALLGVYLHNDHPEPWETDVVVERRALEGTLVETVLERRVVVLAGATERIELPGPAGVESGMLVATAGNDRAFWFPKPDAELAYPAPRLDCELERRDRVHEIRLRARTFVRDLCFFPDRLHPDATVSEQLITLLPGEETTVRIHSPRPLGLEELTRPPVLQSVNRFGAPAPASL